jgi:hypothetical protein
MVLGSFSPADALGRGRECCTCRRSAGELSTSGLSTEMVVGDLGLRGAGHGRASMEVDEVQDGAPPFCNSAPQRTATGGGEPHGAMVTHRGGERWCPEHGCGTASGVAGVRQRGGAWLERGGPRSCGRLPCRQRRGGPRGAMAAPRGGVRRRAEHGWGTTAGGWGAAAGGWGATDRARAFSAPSQPLSIACREKIR